MTRPLPLAMALAAAVAVGAVAASQSPAPESRAEDSAVISDAVQRIALADGVRRADRFVATAHGRIVVEPDGRVSDVRLDMPRATRDIYEQAIARWRFEPMRVGGEPVRAETRFTLIATGTAIDGSDDMRLGIGNVWFHGSESLEGAEEQREPRSALVPPRYPQDAAVAGYGGTVNVLVALDAEGRVTDAGVASLTLSRSALRSERQAVSMARRLADASVSAARGWTFADPAVIAAGSAVVPVTFHPPQLEMGGWTPQIPLDVTPLPWMVAAQSQAVALTAGGEASASGFRLLNDVAGTAIN